MTDILAFVNTLFSMLSDIVRVLLSGGLLGQAIVFAPLLTIILKLIFKGLFGSSGSSSASRIHRSGTFSSRTNGSVPDD